jgi:hypothetical protein
MQTTDLASPSTIDAVIQILFWCVIGFGAVWLVTSVIGYFHRRAYNLTYAESGSSKNYKPDFLKVDRAKRQAAIERGEAFDERLAAREAPAVQSLCFWSRVGAGSSAILALLAMIVGTLTKIDAFQRDVAKLGSWDRFTEIVSQNKTGTLVALIVIGANIIVFMESSRKWRRGKAPARS